MYDDNRLMIEISISENASCIVILKKNKILSTEYHKYLKIDHK